MSPPIKPVLLLSLLSTLLCSAAAQLHQCVRAGYFGVRYHGYKKPNPRDVSQSVIATTQVSDDLRSSAMLMHFGQFVSHDLTLAREIETNCSVFPDDRFACYNIVAPPDDHRLPPYVHLPVKRSQSCLLAGERQQLNTVTSFIDASQVYGANFDMANAVRGSGGRLRENVHVRSRAGLPHLPFVDTEKQLQCHRNLSRSDITCLLAGDQRTNEQLMLTSMHTLFFREHNRIASHLTRINPEWSAEIIWQETRKIVGAVLQKFAMYDWLPNVLGPAAPSPVRDKYGHTDYKPDVNPAVANEVAVAGLRFGHAVTPNMLHRMDPGYHYLPPIQLRDAFFAPDIFVELNDVDSFLRGSIANPLKEIRGDSFLTIELTDNLFPNFPGSPFPLDLAALNIQRGREHALSGYNAYREMCGLPRFPTWASMGEEIRDDRLLPRMEALYGHPDNIDLWVGGLLELPVRGAKVGRTLSCILADQFRRLRQGDRFWFENAGVFGHGQLEAIRHYSLSRVICNNIDEPTVVPPDAFKFYPLTLRQFVPCNKLPDLDLSQWRLEGPGFEGKYDCSSSDCVCLYSLGAWLPCDAHTGRQFRHDRLIGGRYPPCTRERVVTRSCHPDAPPSAVHVVPYEG